MNWQEVLTILIPILSLMAWVYNRIEKRFDAIMEELKSIRADIHH